jgi:hypothetical protein
MTVAIVFESRKVLHDVQKQTWHMVSQSILANCWIIRSEISARLQLNELHSPSWYLRWRSWLGCRMLNELVCFFVVNPNLTRCFCVIACNYMMLLRIDRGFPTRDQLTSLSLICGLHVQENPNSSHGGGSSLDFYVISSRPPRERVRVSETEGLWHSRCDQILLVASLPGHIFCCLDMNGHVYHEPLILYISTFTCWTK